MPCRKSVLSLGNLCVLSITQLLVDIIHLSSEDGQDKAKSNDQQEKSTGVTDQSSKASQKQDEATGAAQQNDTSTSATEEEQVQLQNTKEEKLHAEGTAEEPGQPDMCNHDDSISQVQETEEKKDEKIEKGNTDSDNRREKENDRQSAASRKDMQEKLETLRQELGVQLTSHSHVMLHELLFSNIITRLDLMYMRQKKIRKAVQDILPHFLNSSLRELDFGRTKMFSEQDMCKILFDNLHKAVNLRKLMIGRSCYWRSKIFENLCTKLTHLPQLTELGIQYICTPEMISGLSESCPLLCELNLKGSEKITDQQCEEIAKCSSLKMLDISGTRITGKGCWKIVDSIKNLSWLHHCAFNCNSDSLLFESRADLFDRIKEQLIHGDATTLVRPDLSMRDERFNLKNFWLFNPQTEDLLTSVLFPHLEHIRLDFVFQDMTEEPDVSMLTTQPKLKKLQANLYDRCSVDLVRRMVEACGSQLTVLHLHLADDWFFVAEAHNVVASCCPNLVNLTFSGDYKARYSLEDSDERLDMGIPAPAHQHLEHLNLTGVISNRRLRFVLSHTPALRTLHLDGELEWLHDATFTSILETNPLPDLEEVWFNVSTTVTLGTVRLLLMQENSLRCIGRLCHMGAATMEEYQELLSLVRKHNLDTKLIWVTDERIK